MNALPGPNDILRVELENGITLLARENFASPSVVVAGILRAGAHYVPAEMAGLAHFHGAMLMRGTQRRTFSELYEEIEANGASLGISAAGHTYRFDSKSLAEDLPLMLDLLADVIRNPSFPVDNVEKVRGQILTALEVRADDTARMASLTFNELAYRGHPYAISIEGYTETVKTITREDIVAFHERYIGPRGAIVVVVGAVQAEEAIRHVREAFGDWHRADQPARPTVPDMSRLEDVRERFVLIPGKSQADIVLGYPGPPRSAPDFQAANLANSILGVFGIYGRLGDNVRERQGLAYYSYSRLSGGLGPGPWMVSAGVAPENVERTVESIRVEIRRMVDEQVQPDELEDNKRFAKGRLTLLLETNEGVASGLLSMELHSLGLDYLQNYASQIEALTLENIQAAAQHYLDPDAYALAVAGPGTG